MILVQVLAYASYPYRQSNFYPRSSLTNIYCVLIRVCVYVLMLVLVLGTSEGI